jgi:hypothetical protein
MRRLLVGLFIFAIMISACASQPTVVPVDEDNLEAFVSDGEPIKAEIAGRDVSIILKQDQGVDTADVVVTLVNLGETYLIETADPNGRFLPTVQIEPRLDKLLQEVEIPQIQTDSAWSIRFAGTTNVHLIQKRYLGTTTLESLKSFITSEILGPGFNILLQVPETLESFQQIDVYRTPGTMTFLAVGHGGGSSLLPSMQGKDIKFAAVSLKIDALNDIEPMSLLERVQTLGDGMVIAQADLPSLPTPTPEPVLPECGEGEVLVSIEVDGESVAECQPASGQEDDPTPTATATLEEIGPTPTPTLPPPTPTNTPVPVIYTETFPQVDPKILGTCPESVHDYYTATGPDGQTYRTWHPVTVPLDPTDPSGPTCSFAHEHGDPPHPNAPLPYFGYAAYHGGKPEIIRQHEGYKVFTHKQGQRTGWDTTELTNVNPDIDMQFWVHQGSWSINRLSEKHHDVGFWSRDAGGRITEIYFLANTGDPTDRCGDQLTNGAKRIIASECDYANESWVFSGNVGNVWNVTVQVMVVNPMNHIRGNPNILQSVELINTSEEICGVDFFPCEYKLPFGHTNSIWLGNMRMLLTPEWQWSNSGGSETFCTDVTGKRAADGFCSAETRGYILQRVAKINFFGGKSGAWDRTIGGIGNALYLPEGAPGGN